MPTPIPSNLSPLLKLPAPGSLTLITSVLDATSNWLLLRYIYAALRPENQDGHATTAARVAVGANEETTHDKNKDLKVILISFLRPFELWREMGKKIGLDLPSLLSASNPRLIYIDAFTHLSYPPSTPTPPLPHQPHANIHTLAPLTTLATLESRLLSLIPTHLPLQNYVLVLDSPDLLLAASPPTANIAPLTLSSLLLTLRSRSCIHSTVLTLSADGPLLHNGANAAATPLELSHREFVSGMAHQAERVVQLRGLDTGAARDVSGVLRFSNGGGAAAAGLEETEGGEAGVKEEGEWLYQVKGDGSVRVWTRGE
ncbi:hypothetical protein EPUS_05485 [Endocarpon pusillum Z07020]|uniref:Elongator complex protein 6 n=1 Tax=Endocarpon pusillum (strain Z07020 / HMAS-L-300199) TaxID=1263415 RepID=U1GDZ3_ENDPU|nr:uncharacterized protein EPUS_05485 [Endocarpon pusillum Z07020]ERF69941.1 hypothetical protein EPUS_05485 [Endocarpon pusillum Z07020]